MVQTMKLRADFVAIREFVLEHRIAGGILIFQEAGKRIPFIRTEFSSRLYFYWRRLAPM